MTRAPWAVVRLGDLLAPVCGRETRVDGSVEYRLLGARWYAKGLYVKDCKPGSAIKAATLYRVEEGDFVYNRLFAWKGSFAVAAPDDAGCFVSNEFPCFEVDRARLHPRFLWLYFNQERVWNEALGLSFGATPTSRNRFKEPRLLSMTIPLPPLVEQRRIVVQLDQLSAKMEKVKRLVVAANSEADNLRRAIISDTRLGSIQPTPMSELVALRQTDVEVEGSDQYQFAGVYCFGRGVFRAGIKSGLEFSYKRLTRLRAGDFVYPKLMAWEGALAVVPPDCEDLCVSPEFPVFSVNRERVLPEVLDVHFRSPSVWPELSGASTGTNVRRRRLHPDAFLAYRFPLPSARAQRVLQQVHQRLLKAEPLRYSSTAELDALMPAILDRAFKGEL